MGMLEFRVQESIEDCVARTGIVKTLHGLLHTPMFLPVATLATVKTLTPEQLKEIGAEIIIANTYHLNLLPGADVIEAAGGLHSFMGWDRVIATDSGGFQAFSLGAGMEAGIGKVVNYFPDGEIKLHKKYIPGESLVKITDRGIWFRSHLDKSRHFLSPEKSIEIQEKLGADIILAFDECTSYLADHSYTKSALKRTHKWLDRCIESHKTEQALFGILQGGAFRDLREESVRFIKARCDRLDGIAIGGSLGKSKEDMHKILRWVVPRLPDNMPRHLLGIGGIDDILNCVELGIDMFDCVSPTRLARAGLAYITPAAGGNIKNKWRIRLERRAFKQDFTPIDSSCRCYTCKNFTKSYLHHLFRAREILGKTLVSIHNISVIIRLMEEIRSAIKNDSYYLVKKRWLGI